MVAAAARDCFWVPGASKTPVFFPCLGSSASQSFSSTSPAVLQVLPGVQTVSFNLPKTSHFLANCLGWTFQCQLSAWAWFLSSDRAVWVLFEEKITLKKKGKIAFQMVFKKLSYPQSKNLYWLVERLGQEARRKEDTKPFFHTQEEWCSLNEQLFSMLFSLHCMLYGPISYLLHSIQSTVWKEKY